MLTNTGAKRKDNEYIKGAVFNCIKFSSLQYTPDKICAGGSPKIDLRDKVTEYFDNCDTTINALFTLFKENV